ncbi:hypothetical protein N7450_005203 [Penicillium hetheringtonii]|uniref:Uncharacterized protein n=1 Tax=Penicillium hetheringtonii TaxID=911720 RepID=A0AAD6DRU4_9EURO|nr:hypothetical protein N7450_005203 [Penicillium hetheringtonii]
MYTKFSPTPNATSEEFVQRQLDRVLVAALYLEHNQITREQFQEELSDVCSRVEAQKSHALQEHTLYFDQVMKVFPDLHFRFKPFSKLWEESSTSFPIPGWFKNGIGRLGTGSEDKGTRLRDLLDYVTVRLDYFNSRKGHSHELDIKSRMSFSYNTVEYQGKHSSLFSVPDYSLWHGSENEAAVQLVVFETNNSPLGCRSQVKVCPCCEAQIIATMAMVYSERKNRGEAKCAVYGLSTDCERFAFYHVDDYGYWSYLDLKAASDGDVVDYEDIANLLAFIFYEISCSRDQ